MHISPQHAIHYIEKHLPSFLYFPYKLLVFVPVLVLSLNIVALLVGLLVPVGLAKLARKLPPIWARTNAYASLSKVKVTGRDNIDPNQSYVVVANHKSHFDILAIYGWLGIDLRWIIKQELRKVPALGYICEKLGHVFVDRSNRERSRDSIEMVKNEIQGGTSIMFFPEGTRNEDPGLKPFKMGAFKLAKELDLPILPVTINGAGKILPANTLSLNPGTMEMIIHEPISSKDVSEKDLSHLARKSIASNLED